MAHGERRVQFQSAKDLSLIKKQQLLAAYYVDHQHEVTECYPANPNGSPEGMTAFTNSDGRVTLLMPHPERVFRAVQHSWCPAEWEEDSPWARFFYNARYWVG